MSLLGEVCDARRAQQLGLGGDVVPDEEFDTAVATLARRLTDAAPLSTAVVTRLMRQADWISLDQAMEALRTAVDVVNRSEDVAEGVRAFCEPTPCKPTGVRADGSLSM